MKKFNGTDYDGLLPLAYNALNSNLLNGKSYDDVIQYVQSLIGTGGKNVITKWGNYVGNGKYGVSNPNVITCDFAPVYILIVYDDYSNHYSQDGAIISDRMSFIDRVRYNKTTWGNTYISWYNVNTNSSYNTAEMQYNDNGKTYSYIVFGCQES